MMNLYWVINVRIKVSTRNYELFRSSDLQEWYASSGNCDVQFNSQRVEIYTENYFVTRI